MHRHSDHVMCWHPALNLEVGKMNYGLGNPAPDIFVEVGKKKLSICSFLELQNYTRPMTYEDWEVVNTGEIWWTSYKSQ